MGLCFDAVYRSDLRLFYVMSKGQLSINYFGYLLCIEKYIDVNTRTAVFINFLVYI